MESRLDHKLYERLSPSALDQAWLEFYAARTNAETQAFPSQRLLRARNRLILHYAPIVKYVVYRRQAERGQCVGPPVFAHALLAIVKGMMVREDDVLNDWTTECIALVMRACDTYQPDDEERRERQQQDDPSSKK